MGKGNDPNCGGALNSMASALPDFEQMAPAEVDELWAQAARPLQAVHAKLAETRRSIKRYAKHHQPAPAYLVEREAQYEAKIGRLEDELAPFEAEWSRRGGWPRAYLVTNADGHVHRSTHCSSLHPTTQIVWMPEHSGQGDDDIIAAAGHMACTICYPDAPLHPSFRSGLKQAEAEQKAKQASRCPGSSQPAQGVQWKFASPRGRCSECGQTIGVTRTGKARPHKPPASRS
jgi:hypothetical protein